MNLTEVKNFCSKSPINLYVSYNIWSLLKTNSAVVIFAVVAALGLVTVVAVDIMLTAQEAEASRGCRLSIAVNASKGRCFQPGPSVQSADEQTVEDQVEDEEDEEDGEVEEDEGEEENEGEDEEDEDEDENDE